ncbi:hypothetical protein BGX30_014087 [Mortierella sp. GBA39]|nr:hypothetical protein BGX30_014087 [Mortierella sp. GBA39]
MVNIQTLAFLSLASTALAAPACTLRLVQTAEDKAPVWMTEGQRMELLRKSIG